MIISNFASGPPQLHHRHYPSRLILLVTPPFTSHHRPVAPWPRHAARCIQDRTETVAPVPLLLEQHILLRPLRHQARRHPTVHRCNPFRRLQRILWLQMVLRPHEFLSVAHSHISMPIIFIQVYSADFITMLNNYVTAGLIKFVFVVLMVCSDVRTKAQIFLVCCQTATTLSGACSPDFYSPFCQSLS